MTVVSSTTSILTIARSTWPRLHVDERVFAAYLAERFAHHEGDLAARYASDLYLACACANGDPIALGAFEQTHLGADIDALCRRSGIAAADETRQQIRAKLFVGPSPKILQYAGRSSLRTWLRAVTSRIVIDAARERPRDVATSDSQFAHMPATSDDPDRRLLKQTYREALEVAFVDAAHRLTPRDQNLLRYGFTEGLNIDQIGQIYNVHRVTAARWLQQARAAFAEHVQAVMIERLRLTKSEFESVLRLVMSEFDVTVARVFSGAPA